MIVAGVLIAAVALLFIARYPAGIYDLVVGINRWSYRLVVYLALRTDRYPPLRLDQFGDDPEGPEEPVAAARPASSRSAGQVRACACDLCPALLGFALGSFGPLFE